MSIVEAFLGMNGGMRLYLDLRISGLDHNTVRPRFARASKCRNGHALPATSLTATPSVYELEHSCPIVSLRLKIPVILIQLFKTMLASPRVLDEKRARSKHPTNNQIHYVFEDADIQAYKSLR